MLSTVTTSAENTTLVKRPAWFAVFAVALAVAGLIIAEFLPVSLLTPMAKDLGITEGVAGQAISVTSIVATLSSLFIAVLTRGIDRRWVLLTFCLLQVLSNLLVAYAPNFLLLLAGRLLLGIGLGGFWSMAAATALRLVPATQVSKALAIIYGAVSVATVLAAPLGSYLGTHLGWRNVFLMAAITGTAAFFWQLWTLPAMPAGSATNLRTMFRVLEKPQIKPGMLATFLIFLSYASFFTYLRPFLETVTFVKADTLSGLLLAFGIANLLGSSFSGYLLKWDLSRALALMPMFMAATAFGLVCWGRLVVLASILIGIWGMALGVIQVGWTAWLTKMLPDDAESGGGIQIAVIQLAITCGAAVGGIGFDLTGAKGVFLASGFFATLAALVAALAFNNKNFKLQSK
jgi:predicted MFS family arabinose efflux permease